MTATILIVDDDDHVRDSLVDELAGSYQVRAVGSGAEAMTAMASEKFDVVISDLKMPDHDGIEVLEFAKSHQGDAVRVLLTGYLDPAANAALLGPGAPYKVGKPWHDEVEIVVRRGLEHRDVARRLSASVEDALMLANLDEELAAATTAAELTEVVVHRVLAIEGVTSCATLSEHAPPPPTAAQIRDGWVLEQPLDDAGAQRLYVRGFGESSRQLVGYIVDRAQRRSGLFHAGPSPVRDLVGPRAGRTGKLMRQAAVGTLTASLLHDLASMIQTITGAIDEAAGWCSRNPEATAAINTASAAGEDIIELFAEMRRFIREGAITVRRTPVASIVEALRRGVAGHLRDRRVQLRIAAVPANDVVVSERLFVQVLTNLVRNAANAAPAGSVIDLDITVLDREVGFSITDDGPGVDPDFAESMFEAFATTRTEGTGLGLAISSYVMEELRGALRYRRAPGRGACFTAAVPLTAVGTVPIVPVPSEPEDS